MITRKEKVFLSGMAKALAFMSLIAVAVIVGGSSACAYTNDTDITITSSTTAFGINVTTETIDNSGNLDITVSGSDADLRAYGIYAGYAVTNSGNITATSTAAGGQRRAYGIYTSSGAVDNTGNISASASASGYLAYSWGIRSDSGALTNSGNIQTSATASGGNAQTIGLYAVSGTVTNYGDITGMASLTSGTSATSSKAYGIRSESSSAGAISNYGDISVTAAASGSYSQAYAIFANYGAVNNSGDITATAETDYNLGEAVGIYTAAGGVINIGNITTESTSTSSALARGYGIWAQSGAVTNSGDINATASSDQNYSDALGIYAASGAITNYGTINITATSNAVHSEAIGIDAVSGTVTNSGDISATADSVAGYAHVWGIIASSDVENSGDINATASSDQYYSDAVGIDVEAGTITNSGEITATADSVTGAARAVGIYGGTVVENSGDISATASSSESSSRAWAIYGNGDVTNTGNIISTAVSPADSARAYGIYTESGVVTNSGNITVSAIGTYSDAIGIYFEDSGSLTNTGIIQATGSSAYEVYVSNGTVTLTDRYNMTLDGEADTGSIYLTDEAAMDLNSALLSVSYVTGTKFNTEYRIFDGDGTVENAFGGLIQPTNAAVSLLYHDQGTDSSSDDTVSLSYHPNTSTATRFVDITRRLLDISLEPVRKQQLYTFLGDQFAALEPVQYAAADSAASDASVSVRKRSTSSGTYITPYYTNVRNYSSLGSTSNILGMTAGYDRRFGNYQLGVHASYTRSETDFSGAEYPSGTEETQDVFSMGLQGMGRWGNWTIRADATGFYSWQSYSGFAGLNFEATEKADCNSYGSTENLALGYIFKVGSHVFLPDVGLGHTWINQEGFNTNATTEGWNTDYSSINYNRIDGLLTVKWLTRLVLNQYTILPSVTVGGKYRLSGDRISVEQTVPGSSPVTVVYNENRAAATAAAGLSVRKGAVSAELAYSGEYSTETVMNGVWLKLSYAF